MFKPFNRCAPFKPFGDNGENYAEVTFGSEEQASSVAGNGSVP
jgi:hypothetical protein